MVDSTCDIITTIISKPKSLLVKVEHINCHFLRQYSESNQV